MKKILFACVCALVTMGSLQAQSKLSFGLRISPIFGVTRSIVDSTKTLYKPDGAATRLGMAYGLTVIYKAAENFGIQTGASYVSRGYTIKNDSVKQNTRLSCVEIPVYLRLRRPVGPENLGISVRGLLGADANINVATLTKKTIGGQSTESTDLSGFQPVGACGVFGLGVEWDVEKVGLFDLGVSYHRGITNVLKKSNPLSQQMGYVGIDFAYLF